MAYEDVPANNEATLLKAVANQPMSVVVDGVDIFFNSTPVVWWLVPAELTWTMGLQPLDKERLVMAQVIGWENKYHVIIDIDDGQINKSLMFLYSSHLYINCSLHTLYYIMVELILYDMFYV